MAAEVLRIANCSGFYGDRFTAMREMLEGGPVDVITGDYLAELTMLILWRSAQKDGRSGYARTFLKQVDDSLALIADRGLKVVANAGGLAPAALADDLRALLGVRGVDLKVAHIEGDDLLPRLDDLQAAGHPLSHLDTGVALADHPMPPLTANAYLGAFGIVEALHQGADIVVCPRVTDASVVVGPAAWHFGWGRDDLDALAGAVVAGHVIECGAQATGGNYSFFTEVAGLEHPGFPLAELHADGTSVITKHPGTGGQVSTGTVTAQLLYEIAGPRYLNPDVTTRFDTIHLADDGPDRVRITGVRGEAPTEDLKVCLNMLGGFRNELTFVLTGLDIDAKADLVVRTLRSRLDLEALANVHIDLVRSDHADAPRNAEAQAFLRVVVQDTDPNAVGRRAFANVGVELALASYPGFTMTAPPADATPYGVYWPALVPKTEVTEVVVAPDGTRTEVARSDGAPLDGRDPVPSTGAATVPDGPTERVALGRLVGARSGDKGGNANVGVWVTSDDAYEWLAATLTVDRFRELVPDAADLPVERYDLPNLRALNFVVVGLLGMGVSSSTRLDPQAKGLGEYLRSRTVDVPRSLLDATPG
jgi:hypothetical protein